MNTQQMAVLLAENVKEKNGTAYFVGGCVRDSLLNLESKDIDIEVHGLSANQLEEILNELGKVIVIGKSFGVYNLKGYDLDIALPRMETLTGVGHKDFKIDVDPFIGTLKAAERRDFTINALMKDILTGEIIDHFNGVEDLKNKVIRHVNDLKFSEDPLRVLRAAQFACRFDFSIAPETLELCRKIDLTHLSKERIFNEMSKALLKGEKPSIFFEKMREMDQLDYWFMELKDLIGVKQNPKYHSEGDVWTHTMMVLDEAAKRKDLTSYPIGFMVTALVHDFGKAICTTEIDGVIHSYEHEIKGLPIIKQFIERINTDNTLKKYVLNMSRYHMQPNILANSNSSIKATNKMFDQAIVPKDLIYIALADGAGREKMDEKKDPSQYLFERLEIFNQMMSLPFVSGKDLLDAGLQSDKCFSDYLAYAHKLRLAGVNKESALKQTLAYAKKKNNLRG